MASPKSMLYPGNTTRIIGHTETWISKTRQPKQPERWPGYDQQNPADIASWCKRTKADDVDILMFNTYPVGSWENVSLEMHLPETVKAGLNIIVNIDKGEYDRQGKDPNAEIRNYLLYLRKKVFVLPNYEKWQGKFIVTYFAMPGDDPAMFAKIEQGNKDIAFVYNGANFGHNQMSWVHKGLEVDLESWCKIYANKKDGLYIPHVAPGFNDTFQGHSAWDNNPPRVYPPGIGPNKATLQKHFDVINKYYSLKNPLIYLQEVTRNDWTEGTALEPKADGTGGFFSGATAPPNPPVKNPVDPPTKTIDHGEVWVDGKKLGDLTPGDHTMTLVQVYVDRTLVKTSMPLKV